MADTTSLDNRWRVDLRVRLDNGLTVVDLSVGLQRPIGRRLQAPKACCGSLELHHAAPCPAKPDLPDSMLEGRYIGDGLVEWCRRA